MKKLLVLFCFPLLVGSQQRSYQPITDTTKERDLQIDQLSLDVSVAFDLRFKRVDGYAELAFEPLTREVDSVWLDGPGILIDTLKLDGQTVPFKTYPAGLAIFPTQDLELKRKYLLQMHYRAWPKKGLYFVNWGEYHWQRGEPEAPKQIWTQGQGIDNRHWIPHVDAQNDKLITSLTVTFDTGYTVISNGVLAEFEHRDSVNVWHYKMDKPHSSYLMMLAIGKYDSLFEKSESGISLTNYYYPEGEARNKHTYFKGTEIFNFLEKEIGVPYPWQNYKQVPVMNFQHGAMENTTATIFGDFFCVDSFGFNDRNYVGVNAHELAHQWFGNLVTSTHSTHHWLQEGFASYYAWLAEEDVFGEDRFALLRKESLERVLAAEERDMFPLAHGQAGVERHYDKGAWVLFMLRNTIGEQAWQAGIKSYLTTNQIGLAQTETLQRAMEEACRCPLDVFFEQWVYQSQIPNLKIEVEADKNSVNITVAQQLLEGQKPFILEIPVGIRTNKAWHFTSLHTDGQTANLNYVLPKGEKLLAVIPDPNFEVLANWEVKADLSFVENVAADTKSQWPFAGESLVNHPEYNTKIVELLTGASLANRISFAEALAGKAQEKGSLAAAEVAFLANEKSTDVIKAFLKNTMVLPHPLFSIAENWFALSSYELVEMALLRLCINDKANAKSYLEKTKDIIGTSGHNVRITWLLLYTAFVSQDKTAEITEYMCAKYDFLTRMKAFEAAEQLNLLNYAVANHAFSTLFQGNRKLRNAGRNFIKSMSTQPKNADVFQGWMEHNKSLLIGEELKTIEQLTGYLPKN